MIEVVAKLAFFIPGEEDDEWEIIFAETEEKARESASHYNDLAEFQRKPEFDQYAALGKVPKKDLIEKHGFYWECHCCYGRVDQDGGWEYDEDGEVLDDPTTPVFTEQDEVFCSQACFDSDRREAELARQRIEETKLLLQQRYPFAQKLHVTGGSHKYPVYASFDFGGKHEARWNSGDPEFVSIRGCDIDSWNTAKHEAARE